MSEGRVVAEGLTKLYPKVRAVDGLTFAIEPGRVTGFLGPNGSGKTTTLRMLLGLVRPTSGTATIDGARYDELDDPIGTVGAVLEASAAHKARTGRNHLRVIAAASGRPEARVDEVLEMVGLKAAARRPFGGYSLGMRQRLGIAAAMLGDPKVLMLDEPANGLDPEGIRWLRDFLKALAHQGRTVLVSSHLLAEMEQLADDVIIIAKGQLVAQGPMAELVGDAGEVVRVRTPQAEELGAELAPTGARLVPDHTGALLIHGVDAPTVGRAAKAAGVELHELVTERPDLEDVFLELTRGKAEIR